MQFYTTILPLLALLAPLSAADSTLCSTLTSTRTVYRVVTETHTGTPPASASALNSTSSYIPTYASIKPSSIANSTTTVVPKSSSAAPVAPTTASPFPGAAGRMPVPEIMVGVVAAGAGLLFL